MVSVGAGADLVAPLLAGYPDVALAAINAPQQCVISGGLDSIAAITAELDARDMDFKRLAASQASHSPLMTEVASELREVLRDIRFTEPAITLVSAVSGQVARASELSADYWVRHIAEPVNFMAAMRTLDRRGRHLFIEIGPFATLTPLGKRCVPPGRHLWVPSIPPSDRDGTMVLTALASAYAAGQPISWPDFHRGGTARKIELPAYAFDRRSYRLPAGPTGTPPARPAEQSVAQQTVPQQAVPQRTDRATPATVASSATPEDGDRGTAITRLIRAKVAAVLEYPDLADIADDADFNDLGMDSLLAVRLRKELCASLSTSFPTPEIFNNPTPSALARFLDGHLEKVG
jgi:acyl transferase domain-containing protein